MANIEITNIDRGSVELRDGKFRDETLTVAGAGTVAEGTILARDSVSGKLVVFEKGGTTNENGEPKAVLTHAVTVTGAGDVRVRVLVAGTVNKNRLVIDADGDDSNIDAATIDLLRDYSIVAVDVSQLSQLDNQ